ncbi:MAG TPA: type II toxin-antitoxin system RelE/ParE family toxin [Polyangia bacterium]
MSRSASFHRLAEVELNETVAYYAVVEPELARRFLDEAEHARDQVLLYPEGSPLVSKNVRRKSLHGFPYALFYSVKEHEVRILAVGHHRRRPFYWRGRR